MTGFIPEITTRVTINTDFKSFDKSLELIASDEILSKCFTEAIEHLGEKRKELESQSDALAYRVSEYLSSFQSQIIAMKKVDTGMAKNSVDIMKESLSSYLVGNTATSVEGFPYPLAIEKGRKEVRPIDARALRWWDKDTGEIVFSKKSKAVAPYPFVDGSIRKTEGKVSEAVDEYLNKVMGDD